MGINERDFEEFIGEYFRATGRKAGSSTRLRDSCMDSLDFVEFLMALEERFEINIDPSLIDQDKEILQIYAIIKDAQKIS
ncbi:phosphopantetheine-binding protein [Rhizobium sp. PAMB 3182]